MSFEKKDYIANLESTKNDIMSDLLDDYRQYKTLIIRNCATLNEVNTKIYNNCNFKKSEWIITKVERLKGDVIVVE